MNRFLGNRLLLSRRNSHSAGSSRLTGVPAPASKVPLCRNRNRGPASSRSDGPVGRDRLMPVNPTAGRNRRRRRRNGSLPSLVAPHSYLPGLPPNVGEAKEDERGPIGLRMVRAVWSVVAEIDEARLVGMECESIPYKALAQTPRTRLASRKSSNAITASSAKRTRVHLPLRRGRTSDSNHSSSTWCRKMFERQGEITPPCGEPSVAWRRRPSSRAPAFSHLSIIRRITPSVTRWSRKSRR